MAAKPLQNASASIAGARQRLGLDEVRQLRRDLEPRPCHPLHPIALALAARRATGNPVRPRRVNAARPELTDQRTGW